MKFQSTACILGALSAACLSYTDAFTPSMTVQSRPSTSSALGMVATTEVVNGELKPRKTREVSLVFIRSWLMFVMIAWNLFFNCDTWNAFGGFTVVNRIEIIFSHERFLLC